jgi:sulfur-oxidizing protein SoxZ
MAGARLLLPERVAIGDVITVRLLIQHDMETGYRQDMDGRVIPRNVIRLVRCELVGPGGGVAGGVEVFRAEPSSGISANPFFEFFLRVTQPGDWLVQWEDDAGVKGELRQTMPLV